MLEKSRYKRSLSAAMLRQARRFWQQFTWARADIERAINGSHMFDMTKWMAMHLRAVDPRLDWTAERTHEGSYVLTIGCGPHPHIRPLVLAMLEIAPNLANWAFTNWREPHELGETVGRVRGLTGFDPSRVTVRVERGKHNRFNLTYFVPEPESRAIPQWKLILRLLTESLLGEDMLEIWIGEIQVQELHKGRYRSIRLDQFIDEMERQARMLARTMPDEPPHRLADKLDWHEFRLEPAHEGQRYPEKTDMTWCRTVMPDLMSAWFAGDHVYSERYTAFDETYVYIKARFDSANQMKTFRERLGMRLARERLGGLIGEGTGLAFGYLDYALSDVAASVPIIRDMVGRMRLAKHSWLMFYDADLRAEWVPLHPDAPRPPRFRDSALVG